jgi:uncharacterized protein (DUF2147 family)
MRSSALWVMLMTGLVSTSVGAAALADAPTGLWQTISDTDGKPRALVEIVERDGVLSGRIVGTLRPGEPLDRTCDVCPGERRGQKLLGMTILSGLRRQGEGSEAVWRGGEILDPDSGRTYRVNLTLEDGGRVLRVRGYIGVSLLGRTQRWLRAPADTAGAIDPQSKAGSRP